MTHLVQAVLLFLAQLAVLVKRIVLEEKANLVARFDEVAVIELRLLCCRKRTAHLVRVERGNQFIGSLHQFTTGIRRHKIAQYEHTGLVKCPNHFIGQLPTDGRLINRNFVLNSHDRAHHR